MVVTRGDTVMLAVVAVVLQSNVPVQPLAVSCVDSPTQIDVDVSATVRFGSAPL